MIEVAAGLVVLEVKRVQGDDIRLTPEQLHALILEAFELNNMELPYGKVKAEQQDDRNSHCAQAAQVP